MCGESDVPCIGIPFAFAEGSECERFYQELYEEMELISMLWKQKVERKKMKNKKMSLSICELLKINVILVNTLLLIIERDTVSYEKDVYAFEAIKKSNLISIIQHNPYIGYIYLLCAVILVICGLCRLISRRSRKRV